MAFDRKQFADLVDRTLRELQVHSQAAVNLLLGTAAVESGFGTYLRQLKGPALGVFQMEPATEGAIWSTFLIHPKRKHYRNRIINTTGQIGPNLRALETNISYQIAMCRTHYLCFPEPLPSANDIPALAGYWKKYYNTRLGKGTKEKFLKAFSLYLGGKL